MKMIKEKTYAKDNSNNTQDCWVVKRDSHVGYIGREGHLRKCDAISQSGSYVTQTHVKHYYISDASLRRMLRGQKYRQEVTFKQDWDIVKSDSKTKENLQQDFYELASNWKIQTAHFSTTYHKVNNSSYLKIIGMGEKALPFILKDLEEGPEHWFVALNSITKQNPISEDDFGDMQAMSHSWVTWGKENGII